MGKSKVVNLLLIVPIIALLILNFLLLFTPELGFDALWYHLTLPKLWLLKHQWYFPGGLLYYSVMPRLTETIFIPLIYWTGTVGPKALQYLSGVGVIYLIWRILTNFKVEKVWKISAISLFYCTWLVSWQSGSAYIDLFRTFLEISALYFLLNKSWKLGGVFLGLAIGTKWLTLVSLAIYALVFGPHILFPALIVALPWFFIAFHFTGNPVYPIFGGIINNSFLDILTMLKNIVISPILLTKPYDDFLSPIAGLVFILSVIAFLKTKGDIKKISIIGLVGAISSLLLNPPSSRFSLPYLPALIISAVFVLGSIKSEIIKRLAIYSIILSAFFVLALRLYAFNKYIPFLLGRQSFSEFMINQSPKLPATFVDSDGFISSLPLGSKILVDKLHNLYYFPRDFDHTSWVDSRTGYDYLVTIGEEGSAAGRLLNKNELGIQVFSLKP